MDSLLTTDQLAARLNLSRWGIYKLIGRGKIQPINVSPGAARPSWRYDWNDTMQQLSVANESSLSGGNSPDQATIE